jgi:predicted unusual protein kinase regulating ubiquinone biosynthesis (AarF/ABC1/UbiB family)
MARLGGLAAGIAGDVIAGKLTRGRERTQRVHRQAAARLLSALGTMKGLPMKIGQAISYMDDFLPPESRSIYRAALANLRVKAKPLPYAAIEAIFVEDFGRPPESVFARFDREPIAAASIGQVYRASLHDGTEVVVKVQYPGIADAIRNDMKNVNSLISAMSLILPKVDVEQTIGDITSRVLEECDYACELSNQAMFAELWRDDSEIVVPEPVAECSSKRVLSSEFVAGAPWEAMLSSSTPEERNQYGRTIYRFAFQSLVFHHVFNGDPHPGNYLFLPEGRVAFLDFGCVQRFAPEIIASIVEVRDLARAGVRGERLRNALRATAGLPDDLDAETWDFLEEGLLLILEPMTGGQFRFDRGYTQRLYEMTRAWARRVPREVFKKSGAWETKTPGLAILHRVQFGLFSILAELEAEADWHAMTVL